jgi:peptide deformylase
MILPIYLYGEPVLRKEAEEVPEDYPNLKELAENMFQTMEKANGVGLAAPQVGLALRMFVVDGNGLAEDYPECLGVRRCMINPEVVEESKETNVKDEGCLSIPGISVPIARPRFARVRYYDLDGDECFIEGDGLLGRCLQRETDHLDGRTMFEAAGPMERMQALRDYEYALAHGAKPGDVGGEQRVFARAA